MPISTAIFLAAGAISLFAFLSVTAWAASRESERRTQERYALLRQVAERPGESARLVAELLREEDARLDAKAAQSALKRRQDSIVAGLILIAVGVGMAIMLAAVVDDKPMWTVGLMPMLIGAVLVVYELASGRPSVRS
jgi:hypothetical protein